MFISLRFHSALLFDQINPSRKGKGKTNGIYYKTNIVAEVEWDLNEERTVLPYAHNTVVEI